MAPETIDLRGDGRILLYPRGARGTYQCRIKVPNSTGFVVRTTKTSRVHDASAFAVNLYDELDHHVKQGGTLKSAPTVRQVYDEWRAFEHRKKITDAVGLYFVPFFAKDPIDKVTKARLTDYWVHRRGTFIKRKATNNTLLREMTYTNAMFKYAKAKGYITVIPELNPLEISPEQVRRPTFTPAKWAKIEKARTKWIEEEGIARKRDRGLAAYYLQVLACTGIRMGEARNLKWADMRLHHNFVVLDVRGKTGSRECVANQGSLIWFDTLRRYYTGNQELIFGHPDGTPVGSFKTAFASLLRFAKVPKGKRTIYSIRHMYATERLKHGTNPYLLAKNMGTSVEMVEKHYGHVINADVAEQITRLDEGMS